MSTITLDLGNVKGPQGSQGPTGPAGEDGKTVFTGDTDPSEELGNSGDTYFNVGDGEGRGSLWKKGDDGWENEITFATEGGEIDTELDTESTNPVQNRAIANALNGKIDSSSVSHTPASGGTDPFSTGGAYTLKQAVDANTEARTLQTGVITMAGSGTYPATHMCYNVGRITYLYIVENGDSGWKFNYTSSSGSPFSIPTGFRPAFKGYYLCRMRTNGTSPQNYLCYLWVDTDGTATIGYLFKGNTGERVTSATIHSVALSISYINSNS